MKNILLLLAFTILRLSLLAQDTVYHSMGNDWGGSLLIKKGKFYTILSYFPNGNLRMKGTLKDLTFEYPERKSGMGSTPNSYLTGKTLKATVKVPHNELMVWYENGSIHQEFKENALFIYDSEENDSCRVYFSGNNEIDSSVYFYGNGKVKLKTTGNESVLDWTMQVSYIGAAVITVHHYSPSRKQSFYPTGGLECNWSYAQHQQFRPYYKRDFYSETGEKSTSLFQTNDDKLTGTLVTYYHSGALKSIETIYRDQRRGGYKLFAENGQLIEQGSETGRKLDSVKVQWYENGQMKQWEDEYHFFSWHNNGILRHEHGGKYGLNVEYDVSGNIIRSNYINVGHFGADSSKVTSHGKRDSSGFRDGDWKGFYHDSTLAYRAKFNHGKQDGEFILFYTNGNPQFVSNFQSGVLHGDFIEYRNDRTISQIGSYRNGDKSGDWVEFWPNGFTFRITRYLDSGGEFLLRQFHSDSTLCISATIDSVANEIITEYFQDGKIYEKKVVDFEGHQSRTQYWYKNGQIKSTNESLYYTNGQSKSFTHRVPIYDSIGNIIAYKDSVGRHVPITERKYLSDGTLEMESTHGFNGKNNVLKTYHPNGKLKMHSVSPPDRNTNTTKYYDNEGKLIKKEVFRDGELIRSKDEQEEW